MPLQTIGLIIGVAAILLVIAGVVSMLRGRASVEQRLQTFAGTTELEADKKDSKKRSTPVADSLNRALEGRKVSENLSTQLARADLKVTVASFWCCRWLRRLGRGGRRATSCSTRLSWRFWRL